MNLRSVVLAFTCLLVASIFAIYRENPARFRPGAAGAGGAP